MPKTPGNLLELCSSRSSDFPSEGRVREDEKSAPLLDNNVPCMWAIIPNYFGLRNLQMNETSPEMELRGSAPARGIPFPKLHLDSSKEN